MGNAGEEFKNTTIYAATLVGSMLKFSAELKELFMSISQLRYILIQACWVAWPNGVRARTQLSRF